MRPLHSLLVLLAVLLFGCVAWFLARTSDPHRGVTAAGPVAAQPAAAGSAGAPSELRAPDTAGVSQRLASSVAAEPIAVAAAPMTDTAAGPLLVGRVLDELGAPIADARVLASATNMPFFKGLPIDGFGDSRWMEIEETRTDEQGRFALEALDAGALKLGVRHPGFAPYDADDVARPASAGGELAAITLSRGVFVSGRVVDAAGRPVGGARVLRLSDATGGGLAPVSLGAAQTTTTAGDGSFLVDSLAAGPWALRIESDRHPYAGISGRTQAAGERVEGLLVQLEESGEIAGRVTGELPEGTGFGQLLVRASSRGTDAEADEGYSESREGEIGGDGSFVVPGVRMGRNYSLSVVNKDNADGLMFDFGGTLAAPVEAEAGERGVVLVLSPEAGLRFAVVDARDGSPIESFTVDAGIEWPMPQVDDNGRRLRVHPGGLARVGNLRPRSSGERAELLVESVGYLPYEASGLMLTPGVDTDLGTISLEPAPVLSVRVLDAKTGAPVSGASVVLSEIPPEEESSGGRRMRFSIDVEAGDDDGPRIMGGKQSRARTDEDGVARLTSMADLNVRLRVDGEDHAPWTSEVFRGSAEAEEREVRLGQGGSVIVHLFDAAGEPLPGGRVEHRSPSAEDQEFGGGAPKVSNTAGEVSFDHLAPGRHRFRPAKAGGGSVFSSGGSNFAMLMGPGGQSGAEWVSVEVAEGGVHDVEIHAPLTLEVSGVLTEGGEPLVDAQLRLATVSQGGPGGPEMAMFGASGPQASSDADGQFLFEGVEPGEYTLTVRHPSRVMPAEVELRVVDSDVQRDLDLDVAILEGRVTDSNGEPLAGVEVWPERARESGPRPVAVRVMAFAGAGGGSSVISLEEGGFADVRARTDAEGRYTLRGVLPDVDLEVRSKGSDLQPGRSEPVRVAADEHRRGVDLRMESAGSLEILGARADGSPAANLLITAAYEGDLEGVEPKTFLLDEQGSARIDELAPGHWRLTSRSIGPGSDDAPIPDTVVLVLVGETTPVNISAP